MNYIYLSIVLLCVIIIICLIFIFSRKKSKNPKEAFSSSYLTKDELTNIIKETKKDLSQDNIFIQNVIYDNIKKYLIERVDKLYNPLTSNTQNTQIIEPLINNINTKFMINNFELENIYK